MDFILHRLNYAIRSLLCCSDADPVSVERGEYPTLALSPQNLLKGRDGRSIWTSHSCLADRFQIKINYFKSYLKRKKIKLTY